MAQRIKGKCKFCGKEYAFSYMKKHLPTCRERQKPMGVETGMKQCGYYELTVCFAYNKDYWLFIEIKETATLSDLDNFLRDIWLECCGHLSEFDINGIKYESDPDENHWYEPVKSMNCKLSEVLVKDMTFEHRYDFGSTTRLVITVEDYMIKNWKKEKLTILSRNNPHVHICEDCGEKPAVALCMMCYCDGGYGFLCEDCSRTHNCGEEMQLNVCNSPRMGVCGYNGSERYPDQFVPDLKPE